jgi:hypothetical protein
MDVNSESRIIQHSIKFPYYSHPNCKLWRSIKGLRGSGNLFHELFPTRTPTTSTAFELSVAQHSIHSNFLCNRRIYHCIFNNLSLPRCPTNITRVIATRHPKHHPRDMGSIGQTKTLVTTHQAVELSPVKAHPPDIPDKGGASKLLLR